MEMEIGGPSPDIVVTRLREAPGNAGGCGRAQCEPEESSVRTEIPGIRGRRQHDLSGLFDMAGGGGLRGGTVMGRDSIGDRGDLGRAVFRASRLGEGYRAQARYAMVQGLDQLV
jgi:hypothetical protein